MNCPKCGQLMRERERGDVVMDICPTGHGVWLDQGELERLTLERGEFARSHAEHRDDEDDDEWFYRRSGDKGKSPAKRRKGLLSSLLEGIGDDGRGD